MPEIAQLAQKCYTIRQSESAFSKKTPLNLQKKSTQQNEKTENLKRELFPHHWKISATLNFERCKRVRF